MVKEGFYHPDHTHDMAPLQCCSEIDLCSVCAVRAFHNSVWSYIPRIGESYVVSSAASYPMMCMLPWLQACLCIRAFSPCPVST